MHHWIRILTMYTLVLALSACSGGGSSSSDGGQSGGDDGSGDDDTGGGGGGTPVVSPFTAPTDAQALYYVQDFPNEFAAVRAPYAANLRTTFDDLPRSMPVTYSGFMEISFFTTPNGNIQGPANLTVDMTTGATSGSATGFLGMVYDSVTDNDYLASYEGDVTFSGGAISRGPNDEALWNMQIDGAFDNGVQRDLTVAGQISGGIYGANAEGLYATGSDFGAGPITVQSDGIDTFGIATVWATQD